MNWNLDPRPGGPYGSVQPGMGDASEQLFAAHPIGVPVGVLVLAGLLIGLGLAIGGWGTIFVVFGVCLGIAAVAMVPFGIRSALKLRRSQQRDEPISLRDAAG